MNIAGIALYNVAIIAALAEIAIAGKRASPSFEIEFPNEITDEQLSKLREIL